MSTLKLFLPAIWLPAVRKAERVELEHDGKVIVIKDRDRAVPYELKEGQTEQEDALKAAFAEVAALKLRLSRSAENFEAVQAEEARLRARLHRVESEKNELLALREKAYEKHRLALESNTVSGPCDCPAKGSHYTPHHKPGCRQRLIDERAEALMKLANVAKALAGS